jgi:TDG/mug DNA glycosylase family protein
MATTVDLIVPAPELPVALWRVHREHPVGAELSLSVEGVWPRGRLEDVLHGAGFGLRSAPRRRSGRWRAAVVRERTLADTVGPGMRLLCVGLNPSPFSADAGVGFARPGNRFWPAMLAGGLVDVPRDALAALAGHGIGMTDLVKRATARAAELEDDEHRAGLGRVDRLAAWLEPGAVCLVGLDGWRRVVDRQATPGWQPRGVGGRPVYVMPNPSGLNAHVRVDDLARHLRAAAGLSA